MKFSKKNIFLVISILMLVVNLCAQNAGKKITVSPPTILGVEETEKWIPFFVQGQLLSDIQNFSDFTVIDRTAAEQIMGEQALKEANAFIDENETASIEYAALVDSDYLVIVNILKKSSNWALDCKIIDVTTSKPFGKAYSNANVTSLMIEDGSVIHAAAYELLKSVGVNEKKLSPLTQQTKKQLEQVAAQTSLAKGIVAEQNGMNIEAMTYYMQASASNARLKEVTKRLSSASSKISSGNFGVDAENKIALRNQWINLLKQTVESIEKEPPFLFIYDEKIIPLELTEANYKNNTQSFSLYGDLHFSQDTYDVLYNIEESLKLIPEAEKWGDEVWSFTNELAKEDSWIKKRPLINVELSIRDENNNILSTVCRQYRNTFNNGNGYEYDPIPVFESCTNEKLTGDGRNSLYYLNHLITFYDVPIDNIKSTDTLVVSVDRVYFVNDRLDRIIKYGVKSNTIDVEIPILTTSLFQKEFSLNTRKKVTNYTEYTEAGPYLAWYWDLLASSDNVADGYTKNYKYFHDFIEFYCVSFSYINGEAYLGYGKDTDNTSGYTDKAYKIGAPAYLGISVLKSKDENKYIVKTVKKNSPAEKAGIKKGDAIVYNDTKSDKNFFENLFYPGVLSKEWDLKPKDRNRYNFIIFNEAIALNPGDTVFFNIERKTGKEVEIIRIPVKLEACK